MQPTKNHDEISVWAERHGAVPAEILTAKFDGQPSVLHFLMGIARQGTPELKPITWEDFFARFDLMGLSFAYDSESAQFELVKVEPHANIAAFN